MTHAFFKALLFLGAGVVILAQHHEHDMFKMGGLRKELPVTFWTFVVGSASLSALPLITAGFYSKDLILWQAWSSPSGGFFLWMAGLFGAFITSIYTFRMVFVTFFGVSKMDVSYRPGLRMTIPLVVLAFFSMVGGFVELPDTLGSLHLFSDFLKTVFNDNGVEHFVVETEGLFQIIASIVSLAGISVAVLFYLLQPGYARKINEIGIVGSVKRFWIAGWDFDALYELLFIQPFLRLARVLKNDFIDSAYNGIGSLSRSLNEILSETQNGNIRWYAMGMAIGAVVFLGIVIVLS
jgi:NADH-quinone oxidoreductase subunit L